MALFSVINYSFINYSFILFVKKDNSLISTVGVVDITSPSTAEWEGYGDFLLLFFSFAVEWVCVCLSNKYAEQPIPPLRPILRRHGGIFMMPMRFLFISTWYTKTVGIDGSYISDTWKEWKNDYPHTISALYCVDECYSGSWRLIWQEGNIERYYTKTVGHWWLIYFRHMKGVKKQLASFNFCFVLRRRMLQWRLTA